jgi:hypothetical protein
VSRRSAVAALHAQWAEEGTREARDLGLGHLQLADGDEGLLPVDQSASDLAAVLAVAKDRWDDLELGLDGHRPGTAVLKRTRYSGHIVGEVQTGQEGVVLAVVLLVPVLLLVVAAAVLLPPESDALQPNRDKAPIEPKAPSTLRRSAQANCCW